LGQATSTANQCTANSNTLVAATTVLNDATKASDDGKGVIDRELAVIRQLKDKLRELTGINAQVSDVQLRARSFSDAVSEASAKSGLRASTSLMLAQLMSRSNRNHAETGDIDRLLDQIITKLNAERQRQLDAVEIAQNAFNSATTNKVNSCNAAGAKQIEAKAASDAFDIAEGELNSRNQELTAAKAEASRTSTVLSEVKANYDSEVASLTQMKDNVLSTTSVAAFRAQVDTLSSEVTALSSEVKRLNSTVNDLKSNLTACKTRVQEFEDAARAAAASENTKQTASTEIEKFAPQGLAGTVLVQGICTAIQKAAGWSFAVKRQCGNNAQTCENVCTSENQAQSLQPYNAIHMYGNQPTKEAGQPGLKTYRYNSGRGGDGCGPNYCCCGGGGAQALLELGDASSIDEFLQGAEVIDNHSAAVEQASIDELADKLLGDSDLQMENVPSQSLAGCVPDFEQFGASGQVLAQAACTAINPAQGYTFAIIKGCDVSTDCAALCSQAGRSTSSPSALE